MYIGICIIYTQMSMRYCIGMLVLVHQGIPILLQLCINTFLPVYYCTKALLGHVLVLTDFFNVFVHPCHIALMH